MLAANLPTLHSPEIGWLAAEIAGLNQKVTAVDHQLAEMKAQAVGKCGKYATTKTVAEIKNAVTAGAVAELRPG